MSKIIRVGEEYAQRNEDMIAEDDVREIDEPETKAIAPEIATEMPVERLQRKAAIRRPEKSRRIIFHPVGKEEQAQKALVTDIGHKTGTKQFKCTLQLENSDELIVDFSERLYEWKYENFPCGKCNKTFETKQSLSMHNTKVHKGEKSPTKKTVSFECVNFTDDGKPLHCHVCGKVFIKEQHLTNHMDTHRAKVDSIGIQKLKVRFQEVVDERTRNDEWLDMNSDDINLTEIKETPENAEKVRIAKEKELSNFDEYDALKKLNTFVRKF